MKLTVGKGFNKLAGTIDEFVGRDVGLSKALSGCELSVGLASEPEFGVPVHAVDNALFMGDAAYIEGKEITAAAEAMLRKDPSKIQVRPKYNPETKGFTQQFLMAGDAGFDPIAGQLF